MQYYTQNLINSSLGVEKLSFSLGLVLIFRKISYSTTMEICYR